MTFQLGLLSCARCKPSTEQQSHATHLIELFWIHSKRSEQWQWQVNPIQHHQYAWLHVLHIRCTQGHARVPDRLEFALAALSPYRRACVTVERLDASLCFTSRLWLCVLFAIPPAYAMESAPFIQLRQRERT